MSRIEYAKANEWLQPIRRGYSVCCCECGVVHEVDFRLHKRHIQFRVRLSNRSTGQVRRWMKTHIVLKKSPEPLDKPETML